MFRRFVLAVGIVSLLSGPSAFAAPSSVEELVTKYCAAWSESEAAPRDKLLQEVWAPRGTYTDPTATVAGRSNLSTHIGKVLRKSGPGTRVIKTSLVDMHHNRFRFTWKAVRGDNSVLLEGIDFGEIDRHGRIERITGFFGAVKPLSQ